MRFIETNGKLEKVEHMDMIEFLSSGAGGAILCIVMVAYIIGRVIRRVRAELLH